MQVDIIVSRQNGKLEKWQVDKIVKRQNGKLTKKASRQDGKLAKL
jgi:hypothetical protein